jgi:hypothetical protein
METELLSTRLDLYRNSLWITQEAEYALVNDQSSKKLAVLAKEESPAVGHYEGTSVEFNEKRLILCTLDQHNANVLRNQVTWLQPQIIGLRRSVGMGDRLGIATPGHVRAVKQAAGRIAPIFAQQSIREMSRTGRTPQQVMDDATWGIFEEGWQSGVGADADHLKTKEDIEACVSAGFTFFTFDPGEYVNNQSQEVPSNQLEAHILKSPEHLRPDATGLVGKTIDIEGYKILLDPDTLMRAVLKYGMAVAHIKYMYEELSHLASNHPFEVEISMDETQLPTSPAEHVYIASELKRLGVKWVSFAPRFVGRFEKGVDYIGSLELFKDNLAMHAAIARQLGPYKLSLHSGSDKFSLYSIFNQETHGLAHLKTAGTSYLEALRTISKVDEGLFKEIYSYAIDHYDIDRQSYHVSAQISKTPKPSEVRDWPALLDQFDAREILHVTFGSVLTERTADGKLRFYDRLMADLQEYRADYINNLEKHFVKHLLPFSGL